MLFELSTPTVNRIAKPWYTLKQLLLGFTIGKAEPVSKKIILKIYKL